MLSQAAAYYLITGVASQEYGQEIVDAINAGSNGSGTLAIGATITGGLNKHLLYINPASVLSQTDQFVGSINGLTGTPNISAGSGIAVAVFGSNIVVSTTGGGTVPGGPQNAIQTNNPIGSFYGDSNFSYDGSNVFAALSGVFQIESPTSEYVIFAANPGTFTAQINTPNGISSMGDIFNSNSHTNFTVNDTNETITAQAAEGFVVQNQAGWQFLNIAPALNTMSIGYNNLTAITLNTPISTSGNQAGTLTNVPNASGGNPTGYLVFTIQGVTSYIPYWQ